MRNLTRYIFICFFALKTISGVAQNTITTIIDKGSDKIEEIERDNNTIVHIDFDIVYKDDSKAVYRTLYNTRTYYFYAFASDRISDLDMELYVKEDGNWEKIKTDATTRNNAFIEYTPETTGRYGILIKGYTFTESYTASHYGLIIYND